MYTSLTTGGTTKQNKKRKWLIGSAVTLTVCTVLAIGAAFGLYFGIVALLNDGLVDEVVVSSSKVRRSACRSPRHCRQCRRGQCMFV